ncbi:MAG: aminopeptidase [Pseudomonadota bacterium]
MRISVPKRRLLRAAQSLIVLLCGQALSGCYYLQAAHGQYQLVAKREPVSAVVAAADTDAERRQKLAVSQSALAFAHDTLLLPDNGSYRQFVDLKRDHVVVNVFAAEPFSVSAKTWCYPFVGCLAYRGYFKQASAERYAQKLRDKGLDVITAKVPAYSTLGRFKDPVLNTMLTRTDAGLANLLFHELAHQVLYVPDDTAFNESFASFVAAEGVRRWRDAGADVIAPEPDANVRRRRDHARALLDGLRDGLRALYAAPVSEMDMRAAKARVFEQFAVRWREAGFRSPAPANNAALLPRSLYADRTQAFAAVLKKCKDELPCFYASVHVLAEMDKPQRDANLDALIAEMDALNQSLVR